MPFAGLTEPKGRMIALQSLLGTEFVEVLSQGHYDALEVASRCYSQVVRTTVTLADDVTAAVEQLRRAEGVGVSEAVNKLIREGLAKPDPAEPYVHKSYDIGMKYDVANIGDVLAMLDEFDREAE